ncbi:MAG: flagellar basal body-associated FliL family protein [Treponema sp.]|jgi:flagellar FliL protein|nr:flagellar basal body-associated FliL family protein [Treponema sp.]
MADAEEKEVKTDEPEEGAQQEQKKVPPGLVLGILKWVALVVGAIILIVTVVIITMKIMGGNNAGQSSIPVSEVYKGKQEVLSWYTSMGTIRTRTSDAIPASVVVEAVLGYRTEDNAASSEITARQVEIKDFLRRYFTEKTRDELGPKNEEKLRIEIRNAINDDILSNSKIRDVKFLQLDFFDQ